jgi:two-component system, OmpR family, sensor kinase
MSLRLRLVVALLLLAAVGISSIDAVTYLVMQSNLSTQIDNEALSSANSVARYLNILQQSRHEPFGGVDAPPGSYGELVGPNGSFGTRFRAYGELPPPYPTLPHGFGSNPTNGSQFITVAATKWGWQFRVLLISTTEPGTNLVLAVPLTSVDATLSELRLLEILVGAAVLLGLGGLAWWTVQLGLRPLQRIRVTAGAIAAGDLSQRVAVADSRTEVGQLAVSLNEMLSQIERAFEARAASESRMRQFMADASHELRTPLSSIRGYAELFRHGAKARPADLDKAMSRIESESSRMSQLVDDLLLLARLDEGRPIESTTFDLSQVAVDAAADASVTDRHHPIKVDAPATVEVVGDEARIRQVLSNLVRNAMVHTPAETRVEVGVRADPDGFAEVSVIDHGPGISDEQAAKIFDRFVRLDQSRSRDHGGSGLGLAIVAAIVAAHHGRIRYEPTPGGGATFLVWLPLRPLPRAEDEQVAPTAR